MCFSLAIPQYSLEAYHMPSSRNWGCPVNTTHTIKNSQKTPYLLKFTLKKQLNSIISNMINTLDKMWH